MVANQGHHHRSTTKASNKSFKSRHATKSSLKARNKGTLPSSCQPPRTSALTPHVGKVEDGSSSGGIRKTLNAALMSKLERRNRARQLQASKHKDLERETRIFKGRDAAPRIVTLVPLCDDSDSAEAVRSLLKTLDVKAEVPESGVFTTW